MQRALVIGQSGGIGAALAARLQARGVETVGLSRRHNELDITSEASIKSHLGAIDGTFDLVFVATGALEINGAAPEKSLTSLNASALSAQFLLNAIGPALVLKHAVRLMPRDRRAVFAALSARVGSIGDNQLGGWFSYRAAKAALNQLIHTGAIELARTHPQAICVSLHPGTVQTALTGKYLGRHPAVAPAQAAANLLQVIERLNPSETGQFFDWAGKPVPW